jgi:hypothetical protein
MPDTHTVPVTLDVTPEAAAALQDPATRARVARLVSRVMRPASAERLFAAMDALSAEARRRGLTDEILEEELAAYNAERRERPVHSAEELAATGRALAAEFRQLRRGQTLGGLRIRDLIEEGRR